MAYGYNGVAWCCMFVWWCFREAGASNLFYGGGKTASCTTLMKWAKANNLWVTKDFKPGDVILYDFDKDPIWSEHVGICESATKTSVTCIEGNTSGSGSQDNGGEVLRKTRSISLVLGAFRPKYDFVDKLIKEGKNMDGKRYNNIGEVPNYAKATVNKLIALGHLKGGDKGLDLSEDMLRILVILDRAKVFK